MSSIRVGDIVRPNEWANSAEYTVTSINEHGNIRAIDAEGQECGGPVNCFNLVNMSEPAKPYTVEDIGNMHFHGAAIVAPHLEVRRLDATAQYISTLEEEKRVLQGRIDDLESKLQWLREYLENKNGRISKRRLYEMLASEKTEA